MQVHLIDPQTKTVQTEEFDGKITSIYTFFNSILVDSSDVLKEHIIYTDANHKDKTPFFLGNQLFIGKAIVLGLHAMSETDATISANELESLINYELPPLYLQSIEAIIQNDLNLYKNFEVQTQTAETLQINYEWVIYTFNVADQQTQEYFLKHLEENMNDAENLASYLQKMAALAIKSGAYHS
jgi:hypothetical protein